MEVNNKNFCVFILTYGRPANVYTVNSLKKQGYTGKIYLICSDDDNKLKEYQSNYNNVVVFSKEDYKGYNKTTTDRIFFGDTNGKWLSCVRSTTLLDELILNTKNQLINFEKYIVVQMCYYIQQDVDYITCNYHQ